MRRTWRAVAFLMLAAFCAVPARGNSINVATFGAIPDDGINDSTAINNAIAAAAPGDTVQLNAGTYDLSSTLVVGKSNITFQGTGLATTTLRRNGTSATDVMSLSGVSNVQLTAFTLDGNNNTKATNGIEASSSTNLNLHDLAVKNLATSTGFAPQGIYFSGNVSGSVIRDNSLSNIGVTSEWGAGIRVGSSSSNNQVLENTITNTGRGGILCNDGSTDLVIKYNTVSGSGQNGGTGLGIELFNGCERADVEWNRIDHWISVDSSNNLAVRNNLISDHSGVYKYTGLELVDAHDDVFTGNVVDGGQQIGISISGPNPKQRVYWGHNTISGASTWGVQIQGESGGASDMVFNKNTFQGTLRNDPNTLFAPEGHGVRFNGDASNITFQDNDIKNNQGEGVQLSGGNLRELVFVDNRIIGNGLAAAENQGVNGLRWSNNTVSGNGTDNQLVSTKSNVSDGTLAASRFSAPLESLDDAPVMVGEPVRIHFASGSPQPFDHVLWDFDDGAPSTDPDATHVYWTSGDYRITRIAWDAAGASYVDEATITVVPEPCSVTMASLALSTAAILARRRRGPLRSPTARGGRREAAG